jgi:hypothetical protein
MKKPPGGGLVSDEDKTLLREIAFAVKAIFFLAIAACGGLIALAFNYYF